MSLVYYIQDFSAMLLKGFIKRMPAWMWRRVLIKMCQARPKVSFLPLVEDKGTEPPLYQASFEKTLAIFEERNKAKAVNVQGVATAQEVNNNE